jgi:hypothetical protein
LCEPAFYDIDDVFDLGVGEGFVFWDVMDFLQAVSAACSCCVLSDEDGMALIGRLSSIVFWFCVGQTFGYEIAGVIENCIEAFVLDVCEHIRV